MLTVPKDCHSGYPRCNLLEQFQPFCAHAVFELGKSGSVAARPRQARDPACADWVDDIHEHD